MRPIHTKQNAIECPINEVFGTQANVRILRVLAEDTLVVIGATEAAQRSGLTVAGARRALQKLAKTGIVETLGGGKSQRYKLRENDVLTNIIRALFQQESERYQQLKIKIRNILSLLPEVIAAWMDQAPESLGEPMQIGIVADGRSLAYLGKEIQQRMGDLEKEYDLIIDIRTFSIGEADDFSINNSELLYGFLGTTSTHSNYSHRAHDERTARASAAIAKLLENNPSLTSRAIRHADNLLKESHGTATHDIREWRDLLQNYSQQRLRDFLVAESPRSLRLRQSSPFFAVLEPKEREIIFNAIEEHG